MPQIQQDCGYQSLTQIYTRSFDIDSPSERVRIQALVDLPLSLVAASFDTAVGLLLTPFNTLTGGRIEILNHTWDNYMRSSVSLLSRPVSRIFEIVTGEQVYTGWEMDSLGAGIHSVNFPKRHHGAVRRTFTLITATLQLPVALVVDAVHLVTAPILGLLNISLYVPEEGMGHQGQRQIVLKEMAAPFRITQYPYRFLQLINATFAPYEEKKGVHLWFQ